MSAAAGSPEFTTAYRGSVKDLLIGGPRSGVPGGEIYFEYTDAYSVFDWGRMPDLLPRKGESLAMLAAWFFERLEDPATWQEFSRTREALDLRKGNRFGAAFNEVGETLKAQGLASHYVGVLAPLPPLGRGVPPSREALQPLRLSQANAASRHLVVRPVAVVKPESSLVLGRAVPDYLATRAAPAPRLVPLEVVFRFSLPEGSSLLERVLRDPGYLAQTGFGDWQVGPGAKWDFPVLELFTKLESTDRPVGLGEALAISGLSALQLEEILFKTAWTASCLRWLCGRAGLELADGKLEWAVSPSGECFLVDAIGPDELRLLQGGVQLSKEFLRGFYRGTPWYEATQRAKKQAQVQGVAEWKRLVADGPPPLSPRYRDAASQLYVALAGTLMKGALGISDFPELPKVVREIQALVEAHRT